MNKKASIAASALLLAMPLLASAAYPTASNISIPGLINAIFNILWPIAVAFFVIMFVIAAFRFATAQGDPAAIGQARQFVIWGIVGVAVAVLAFSIPLIVENTITSTTGAYSGQ